MSKGVQLWPGDRMRAFYRRHIEAETSLDRQTADRLVEALTNATNRMLVWEMPAGPVAAAKSTDTKSAKADAEKAVNTGSKAASGKNGKQPTKGPGTKSKTAPAALPEAVFDPYAFSAMVVLAKQGRDALAARLAEIKSIDHLKKLADAQHLGLDRSLTKIDDIRKALLTAAEQRLADRRAAAS